MEYGLPCKFRFGYLTADKGTWFYYKTHALRGGHAAATPLCTSDESSLRHKQPVASGNPTSKAGQPTGSSTRPRLDPQCPVIRPRF